MGDVSDEEERRAVHAALDASVDFIDITGTLCVPISYRTYSVNTADVYGDGRSECHIAAALEEREEASVVATKAGRRLSPHEADGYTGEDLRGFVEPGQPRDGDPRLDEP